MAPSRNKAAGRVPNTPSVSFDPEQLTAGQDVLPQPALPFPVVCIGASAGGIMVGLSAAVYGYATAVWVMPIVLLMSLPLIWSAGRSTASPVAESA